MRVSRKLPLAAAAALLVASLTTGQAAASEIVGRNASNVRLGVSRDGSTALVTFTAQGRRWRVRSWGAINARGPSESQRQIEFKHDFSGGKPFRRGCRRYDGPRLEYLVAACKARDGSYWALQQWARLVRVGEQADDAARELRLSHWSGAIAELTLKMDWSFGVYDNVYGRLTYRGQPVHGFRSTPKGVPRDTYGRNIYLDTYNSRYGIGWRRVNGFLARRPTGGFCYALRQGKGAAYRASAIGPGVTPDVFATANAPGAYNRARDLRADAEQRQLVGKVCY
jgi:hypothetical protein